MISGFIAKKGKMTSTYNEKGEKIVVTTLIANPVTVTQIKDLKVDGYSSIQVAYGKAKKLKKPISEKIKKLNLSISPFGFKEFKSVSEDIKIGDNISADSVFNNQDIVNVTGKIKGRGFTGVIKRWGFHRQPVSGGQSDRVRAPGSIGAQTPGKVVKGKKMPGHYGNKNKTISNLKIASVDKEKNLIFVNGSIPGSINSWVIITHKK